MDQEQLQQKIAEYYAKLPIEAQTMFAGMEWMKTLENLSGKYSLTPLQIQSLGTETTLLLLGIVHPDEYINFLKADLSLSADTQNKLMADINLGILNKWRDTLTQAYEQNTSEIAEKEYGGEKKLDERFAGLPSEVKEAILNSNYQKELYIIANEAKLSIDQMGKLENVTNKILLGIIHPDQYNQMVATELGLSIDQANDLANKVNDKVLKNIREVLKTHAEVHAEIPVPIPPKGDNPKTTINETPKVSTPVQPIVPEKVVTVPMATFNQPGTNPMPEYKVESMPNVMPLVQPSSMNAPEKKIFGDSGIEMMQEVIPPNNLPTTENVINKEENMMQKSGVSIMPDDTEVPLPPMQVNKDIEREMLNSIENPAPTTPINMPKVAPITQPNVIQTKLSQATVNIQSATDQSLPKMGSKDPYREPVE